MRKAEIGAKDYRAEWLGQLKEATRSYSAYYIVQDLIKLLRETKAKDDELDANLLDEIVHQLH